MLTIIDANATPSPTRVFAEAAWRAMPQLSPSWWRENQGFTHSKLALQVNGALPARMPHGVNLVLAEEVMPVAVPDGVVVMQRVAAAEVAQAEGVPILAADACEERALRAALQTLERRVAEGQIGCYGIEDAALGDRDTPRPLHALLAMAAEAAEAAWGRKRRPALRVMVAPFDILNLGLLQHTNTLHKAEPVSALELAARLGLWVVANPTVRPSATAPAEALQALGPVAAAEAALHEAWQGRWPHIAGLPLFSVLKLLEAGQAPWPDAQTAQRWQTQVWPALEAALVDFQEAALLRQHWQALLPWVEALGNAAAAGRAKQLLNGLNLAQPWGELAPDQQHLALLSSIPGIGAVLMPADASAQELYALPDIPDMGAILSL